VGVDLPKFYEALGRDAEFVYGAATWLPELVELRAGGLIPIARQYPGAREFVESYNREFPGADLSFHSAAGYGGCQILVEAIRRVESLDSGKLIEAMSSLPKLSPRNDSEPLAPADPIDPEVTPVRREDEIRPHLLGEDDQAGVRVVHGEIGILIEKLASTAQRGHRRGYQHGTAAQDEIEAGLPASPGASQKMRGFGQDRFRADHRPFPGVEEAAALLVILLAPVEETDEGAGIEKKLSGHASGRPGRRHDASSPGRECRTPPSR
jgi:hypothetical protein